MSANNAFICRYETIVSELTTSVAFSFASRFLRPDQLPTPCSCKAIWDTGAVGSVISRRLAERIGLVPVSTVNVTHVGGTSTGVPLYLVDIFLPNGVRVVNIRVHEAELDGFDALIGMDIIRLGDIAVSNFNGKTTFSFRIPSKREIDFYQES